MTPLEGRTIRVVVAEGNEWAGGTVLHEREAIVKVERPKGIWVSLRREGRGLASDWSDKWTWIPRERMV